MGPNNPYPDSFEEKNALDELRRSEVRYRAVVEQASEMIFFFSVPSLHIVEMNPAFRRSLGYGDEDLGRLSIYDLVDADKESVDRNIEQVVAGRQFRVGRRRYRQKDGRLLDVEVNANHLQGVGEDLFCVVARDLSEEIRAKAALLQSQKLESLGVLAGGIAHDFNNLLTAILGNLSLAQMNLSPVSKAAPYLGKIEGIVQRAADLTRQMLAYSGRGHFLLQAVDLRSVVDEMAHLLEVSISKKAALRFHLPGGLPPIEADPAQIQQVVMNLVTNASEAIGDHEGAIALSADALMLDDDFIRRHLPGQTVNPGLHVILEVSDTGCGMNRKIMARMFDPFFTTKVSGRGLGLSAMLGILRGHRAGINIYSEEGKGSTFKLFFPVPTTKAFGPAPASPTVLSQATLPRGTVMVVDDESVIRTTASAMLESMGFSVLEAEDGLDALEQYKARKGEILLVLMDLTMPRMDGLEAFKALRELTPEVKIILSSGYNQQETIKHLHGKNAPDFLQKPYQFRDLRAALEMILLRKS